MAYNLAWHRLCERCSVIPRRAPRKSKKSGKSEPAAKRGLKDLPPKKTNDAKGGTKVMANAHEVKKALIGNLTR
jgi:hypothetical protein